MFELLFYCIEKVGECKGLKKRRENKVEEEKRKREHMRDSHLCYILIIVDLKKKKNKREKIE